MREDIKTRVLELACYVLETGDTVRGASKKFGVSKSTVHKDLSERLPLFNRNLFVKVKKVLSKNLAERHFRGGQATKIKYENKTRLV